MTPFSRRAALALVPVLFAAFATGCGAGGGAIELSNPGPAAETVNGEKVPQRLVDAMMRQHNWDASNAQLRERALQEVTTNVLLVQASKDFRNDDKVDLAAAAELGRLQAVAAVTRAAIQSAPIDDAALRAEYDRQAQASPDSYDFTQVVFKNEENAKAFAADIAAGKTFEQAADAHKAGGEGTPRSFAKVQATKAPEAVIRTLAALKPGETAKAPVQSPFGWHVVRLDRLNKGNPIGPFEQRKELIRRSMQKRAVEERVLKLRSDAKIVLADGTVVSADAKPAPTAAASEPKPADEGAKP